MYLDRLLTLIANLLPLAGVWWWGWDAFEVLILYWMQTVLTVAFTLLHIRKLPLSGLGEFNAGGRMRPARHRDHIIQLSIVGFLFCAGHIGFLWVFFSGDWGKLVNGPVTFWQHFVIENGAWLALVLNIIGGLVRYLMRPPRSIAMQWIGRRIRSKDNDEPSGNIDDLQLGLFMRIFAMQAAIIFGAMLVMSYAANLAPLIILIVLKTLFDLGASFPARKEAVTPPRTSR